tara:strand:+ start:135 stop:299 length:165 start_codon:yes stop_codon:yes gene_type:complete
MTAFGARGSEEKKQSRKEKTCTKSNVSFKKSNTLLKMNPEYLVQKETRYCRLEA